MNKHLEQLIELSQIDKEIDAFEPQIEEANLQYDALTATKNGIINEISALKQEIKDEQLKNRKTSFTWPSSPPNSKKTAKKARKSKPSVK